MSWTSDLLKAGRNVVRIAGGLAVDGVRSFNDFVEERQAARETATRWEEIDERLEKAAKDVLNQLDSDEHKPGKDPKGLQYDPFDMISPMGYRERPSAFTYQSMEMVGRGVPVVADVIKVRATQVTTFCRIPADRHSPGFEIRLRDWRNKQMTAAARKEAAVLEQVLLNTGFTHPQRPQDGVALDDFAQQVISDSLIFDQVNFEIVPDRRGLPSYLRLLDPSTIRLLDMGERKPNDPFAVQVINGSIVADWTRDELAFCTRNKRTGIRSHGYGLSELETLVREITGFLWGMDYNRKFFCAVDQLVTTENGMERLSDLVGKQFQIWNGYDWRPATAYATGAKPVVRTLLWNGLMVETSPKHRFRVIREGEAEPTWVCQEDLLPTDHVLIDPTPSKPAPDWSVFRIGHQYTSSRVWGSDWTPTEAAVTDLEFWEMIGFALGDGHFGRNLISIFPHYEKDAALFQRFLAVCQRHGISADTVTIGKSVQRSDGEMGYPAVHIHHTTFIAWLRDLGFGLSGEGKRIPDVLFRAPYEVRCALLRGLFSADGHTHRHRTGYATPTAHVTDPAFRQTVLSALWSVGVAANDRGRGWSRPGDIRVQDVRAYVASIGYLQAYKNEGLRRTDGSANRWDTLAPGVAMAVADTVATSAAWLSLSAGDRGFVGKVRAGISGLSRPRAVRWLTAVGAEIPEALRYAHIAVDVIDHEPLSTEPMFDVEVFDIQHLFLLNHIGVHNTQGSATKGILNFKGTIPDKQMKAFRRQWYAMVAGIANAWRTPITNAEELQWINMQLSNRDMEYNAWMDFLIKIICARFQIAPEEVQFSYGNTGQSQAMGQAPIEEKLKASRDLGLRPLVLWFFKQMNRHLITRLNPDFEAVPVGLDERGFDAETDLLAKQQKIFLTIDEARQRVELEPIGEEKGGDLILDPTYLQFIQSQQMAEEDDGEPGAFNVGFDDDDDDAQDSGDAGDAFKSERKPDRVHYVAPLA